MNILLDTCTFLWLILDSPELSDRAQRSIRDPNNDVSLSAASTWEIAVKHDTGRLEMPQPVDQFIIAMRQRHEIQTLELTEEASLQAAKLPNIHRDPFDRMLICQAITHGLTLLTPDRQIQAYPIRTFW